MATTEPAHSEAARQRVRDAMSAAHWTNTDLARTARVDVGTVNDFLAGERWPRLTTLGKIDRAFDWPIGTTDRVARTGEPGDVSPVEQALTRALLDLDLSDLPPAAQEEVITAARLKALEKAREIRRSLEE